MMLNKRTMAAVALAATAALALGLNFAAAAGAPEVDPLVYQGQLLDKSGALVATSTPVQVALFKSATPGTGVAVCQSPVTNTEKGTGRFSVALGSACVKAAHENSTLYVEVVVGATTKTILPRSKLAAVPFALEADHAKTASGATGQLKSEMDALKTSGLGVSTAELNTTSVGPNSAAITTKGGTLHIHASVRMTGTGETEVYLRVDGKTVATATNVSMFTGVSTTVSGLKAGSHLLELKGKSSQKALYGSILLIEVP